MSKSVTIGQLLVNVLANTTGFVTGMGKSRKALSDFEKSVAVTQKAVSRVTGILAGVGVAFSASKLIGDIVSTADAIDTLSETANRLNIGTDKLAGLQYGAQFAGIGADQLTSSLTMMNKQIGEAIHGAGKAKVVFKEMGVDASTLARMAPDQALGLIADKLNAIGNEEERVRAAMRVFGGEGDKMLTFLEQGSEGLAKMQREAAALGIAISPENAKKVGEFADAMDKLKATMGGAIMDLTITVAPEATKWVESFGEAVRGFRVSAGATGQAKFGGVVGGMSDWWSGYKYHVMDPWLKGKTDVLARRQVAAGIAASTEAARPGEIKPGWRERLSADDRETMRMIEGQLPKGFDTGANRAAGGINKLGSALERIADRVDTGDNRNVSAKLSGFFQKLGTTTVQGLEIVRKAEDDMADFARKNRGNAIWTIIKNSLTKPGADVALDLKTNRPERRDQNVALEEGTVEAYQAINRSTMRNQEAQLAETRKHTQLLSQMNTALKKFELQTTGLNG